MSGSVELARTVVDELVRGGVTDAVLSPGSRSGPVAFALAEADAAGRLRLHVRVDERGAAFLALGLSRRSGRPVAVTCTSGTAVANLHPGLLEARHSGVPLVALTADRPAELQGVGANQTTDHHRVLAGTVGWSARLVARSDDLPERGAYWRATVSRALLQARGHPVGQPGPVLLNLELSEPLVPTAGTLPTPPGRPDGQPWARSEPAASGPGPALWLDSAVPTLVLAGDGAGPVANEVATRAGWPVLAEPTSGAWGGPAAIPSAPAVAASARFRRAHPVGRLVVFGRPTLSRSVLRLLTDAGPEVVVVTGRPAEWPDPGHRVGVVTPTVAVRGEPRFGWQNQWRAAGARAWLGIHDQLAGEPWPTEPGVVARVIATIASNAVVLLGSSQPIRDVYLAAAPRAGLRLIANRGLSGIDGSLSTAMGLALAHGGPGYAVVGDLAFWHDATALVIGPAEPRPSLCVVVVNNDGGGIFGLLEPGEPEHAAVFERVFATPLGADIGAWCAGAGIEHVAPGCDDELVAALAPRPGVRVVEVRVDRGINRALQARLREAAQAAIDAP
jgi:2-succinyl-5-enolpyruvyl-6-hydroxy-3-cyclohexene-1-carboxylate synthase